MGFVSGAPTGANIAAKLREKELCTNEEGERLIAFTNNCSPLFILITISVATLESPQLGIWLLLSHYPVNLLLGIILSFFAPKELIAKEKQTISFSAGLKALINCPRLPVGELLSNSIKKALGTIITIGGFIVFFAVLTAILEETGLLRWLGFLFKPLLSLLGLDPSLSEALAHGFFETTIGIAKLPQSQACLMEQTMAASIIIAWNGLSIQAQVAAMVYHTKLKLKYYLISRVIHSIIAPLVIIAAMPYIQTSAFSTINIQPKLTPLILLAFALGTIIVLAITGLYLGKTKKTHTI
jgi:sporulation integral membrane protein YlbJ